MKSTTKHKIFMVSLFPLLACVSCSPRATPPIREDRIEPGTVYRTVTQLINIDLYDVDELESGGTRIQVFTRKTGGLNKQKIVKAIHMYWPRFTRLLNVKIREIAVVDFEAPLGGGPLGQYVVGIYSSSQIKDDWQKMVHQATGWPPQSSTRDYVEAHYSRAGFADPEQAYIDDMVVHELGHTIFGFGETRVPDLRDDWWFCFGLGLVYDRIIWNEFQSQSSPLFDAPVEQWKNVFAKETGLDQRLVHPDTGSDAEFDLNRFQVYGHGKALVYLTELRRLVGPREFDDIVRRYVSGSRTITYDDFLDFIPDKFQNDLKALEKRFQVR